MRNIIRTSSWILLALVAWAATASATDYKLSSWDAFNIRGRHFNARLSVYAGGSYNDVSLEGMYIARPRYWFSWGAGAAFIRATGASWKHNANLMYGPQAYVSFADTFRLQYRLTLNTHGGLDTHSVTVSAENPYYSDGYFGWLKLSGRLTWNHHVRDWTGDWYQIYGSASALLIPQVRLGLEGAYTANSNPWADNSEIKIGATVEFNPGRLPKDGYNDNDRLSRGYYKAFGSRFGVAAWASVGYFQKTIDAAGETKSGLYGSLNSYWVINWGSRLKEDDVTYTDSRGDGNFSFTRQFGKKTKRNGLLGKPWTDVTAGNVPNDGAYWGSIPLDYTVCNKVGGRMPTIADVPEALPTDKVLAMVFDGRCFLFRFVPNAAENLIFVDKKEIRRPWKLDKGLWDIAKRKKHKPLILPFPTLPTTGASTNLYFQTEFAASEGRPVIDIVTSCDGRRIKARMAPGGQGEITFLAISKGWLPMEVWNNSSLGKAPKAPKVPKVKKAKQHRTN